MPDRKLRSNFTPGTTPWAMRRAQWSALGLSDEDLEKPKIAIVNSSSQLASCFSHLDQIVAPLKRAIEEAGGVAFEVRTAAPSDAITSAGAAGQYILPSRDLIASDIEVAVEGALLDGMVCLASCDKTTPGQLMAAGRLDVPTIIIGCGYQPSGMYHGEPVDFEDIFRFAGHVNAGRMTVSELGEMSRCAVTGPGVCAGMGTANSMHLAAEALGMALPGTTPVLALGPRMWDAVAAAGARIVALVEEDLRPRSLLTSSAFANAVIAILAVSGSVNCLKHLQAIAVEAGADVDVYRLFEELAPKVPLLADVKPNGNTQITEFEAAGGTRGLLRQLAPLLDLSARSALMFAIDGAGLSGSVAVITDGQMSGLVNGGLVVAEVSPEGAAGGPLGLVRDGDMISIDVDARALDLEVSAAELDARRAELPPLRAPAGCGWLSVYARTVTPLGAGATLGMRNH
ncbi:dihydroxy-acid dehydratase domain-containing protein [Trebonia kvetii]|nr:dihydroxy-acid dehydratase [Trebonia kvetii]